MRFEKCELGYILESEGPQEVIAFQEGRDYVGHTTEGHT